MASTEAEVCCTNATFVERPEEVEGWCEDLGKKLGVLRARHHRFRWQLGSLFHDLYGI
jgi:hypothetical protein